MSLLISAADVPVEARTDYWQRAAGAAMVPVEGRPADGPDFSGRIRAGSLGAVGVVEAATPAAVCERHPDLLSDAHQDLYELDVVAAGGAMIEHHGGRADLLPGDCMVVDPARPCRWTHPDVCMIAITFPRALLPLAPRDLDRLTGVRMPGDHGPAALLSTFARQVPRHLDDYDPAAGARLGTTVVDLLTTVLAAHLDAGSAAVPPEAGRSELLVRVNAFIERRLADPELSPAQIAEAHHISLRQLYRLFEARGTTVAAWIRHRRLARCRRDLLDPGLRDRTAAAIGARWGFPDAPRFSRAFRAEHGLPPGEYRLLASPGTGPGAEPGTEPG